MVSCSCSVFGSPFSLSTLQGTIQSPGYPANYFQNEDCKWIVNPPEGTYPDIMVLKIVNVETNLNNADADDDCLNAETFVEAGDGGERLETSVI